MFYDARTNRHGLPLDPFKALVAPRPIAWISTISKVGVRNLAPYSFFNAFAQEPHYIAFGSGGRKDSLVNIEATREFAVNLVSHPQHEGMNASSATVRPEVDEFDLAQLASEPCRIINAPRVVGAPVCLECLHFQTVALPSDNGEIENFLVIGRVVGIHIDDRYVVDGRINTAAMRLVARLGYSEYTTVEKTWRLRRPD
jgi:flavin reductase (DIM6/NTAB) family NADH-FMN oxidoreductase RutF